MIKKLFHRIKDTANTYPYCMFCLVWLFNVYWFRNIYQDYYHLAILIGIVYSVPGLMEIYRRISHSQNLYVKGIQRLLFGIGCALSFWTDYTIAKEFIPNVLLYALLTVWFIPSGIRTILNAFLGRTNDSSKNNS